MDNISVNIERVDDIALLMEQMKKMRLPFVLDELIPSNKHQRDLTWGWTATIWLAYILSEGDHRKVSMRTYVENNLSMLSKLSNQDVNPLDFDDDRLSHLLKHFGNEQQWSKIEDSLNKTTIEIYELKKKIVRLDTTTVSGYHHIREDGLIQYGYSKDDPKLPQIKVMVSSLDPLGMPLGTEVLSGEQADDNLYIPGIDRIENGLDKKGLLFVGDSKLGSLKNRIEITDREHYYLTPLALKGKTAENMKEWISTGVSMLSKKTLDIINIKGDDGNIIKIAEGYEFEQNLEPILTDKEGIESKDIESKDIESKDIDKYKERVLIIHSLAYAKKQIIGLKKRLDTAVKKINKLTPQRARGKKQVTDETELLKQITAIIKKHKVEGLIDFEYEKEIEEKVKYIGRGRGSNKREKEIIIKERYQITKAEYNTKKLEEKNKTLGWRAFATNAPKTLINIEEAVLCYRKEYRVERIFNRLKSRLNIAPLFVKNDEQISGMTYLLSLGVRVLTLMEFVIRKALKKEDKGLANLHPENKKKLTKNPTIERVLKAFKNINFTLIFTSEGDVLTKNMPILSDVQKKIIQYLGLESNIYEKLAF